MKRGPRASAEARAKAGEGKGQGRGPAKEGLRWTLKKAGAPPWTRASSTRAWRSGSSAGRAAP
eukprot:3477245-Prymnesium_polylepis.3